MNRLYTLMVILLAACLLSASSLDAGVIEKEARLSVSVDQLTKIANDLDQVHQIVGTVDFEIAVSSGPQCGSILVEQETPDGYHTMAGNREGRAPPTISGMYLAKKRAAKDVICRITKMKVRQDLPGPFE